MQELINELYPIKPNDENNNNIDEEFDIGGELFGGTGSKGHHV